MQIGVKSMALKIVNSTFRLGRPDQLLRVPRLVPKAEFHVGRILSIQSSKVVHDGASFIKGSVNDPVILPPRDKVTGSYHWSFERFLSIGLIPLTVASVVNGAHPITDLFLGVALPIHSHIGFDSIITDYLPARRAPIMNKVSTWGLRGATLVVLLGCYQFNTNDVGISELVRKIWHV
ncbi:hypothetical protein G9A89_005535 [Geosiphon pyriformis]|nr:hypothetical protein G9A89_005535 [Geosiphon pyriformis]